MEHLGHTLSNKGIAKVKKANDALKMPAPTNFSALKPFLTSVQLYSKFLVNSFTILEPIQADNERCFVVVGKRRTLYTG